MGTPEKEKIRKQRMRVLLVEDHAGMRDTYKEGLSEFGADVVVTSNLEEAQKALEEREFTHVISDGLKGDWETLARQAKEMKVKFTLVSFVELGERAKELGVEYIDKVKISLAELTK